MSPGALNEDFLDRREVICCVSPPPSLRTGYGTGSISNSVGEHVPLLTNPENIRRSNVAIVETLEVWCRAAHGNDGLNDLGQKSRSRSDAVDSPRHPVLSEGTHSGMPAAKLQEKSVLKCSKPATPRSNVRFGQIADMGPLNVCFGSEIWTSQCPL